MHDCSDNRDSIKEMMKGVQRSGILVRIQPGYLKKIHG